MRFRLLAGEHVQGDQTQKPTKDAAGNDVYPERVYKAGEVVDSDTDLERRFGASKFQALGRRDDRGEAYGPEQPGSVNPGGQVTSGHQATIGLPDGGQISGLRDQLVRQPAVEDAGDEDRARFTSPQGVPTAPLNPPSPAPRPHPVPAAAPRCPPSPRFPS